MKRVFDRAINKVDDDLDNAWNLPGLSAEVFFAAPRNSTMKTRPSSTDQNIESTLIAIGLPAH